MRHYKTHGYQRRAYEDFARILGECASREEIFTAIVQLFKSQGSQFDSGRFEARVGEWMRRERKG